MSSLTDLFSNLMKGKAKNTNEISAVDTVKNLLGGQTPQFISPKKTAYPIGQPKNVLPSELDTISELVTGRKFQELPGVRTTKKLVQTGSLKETGKEFVKAQEETPLSPESAVLGFVGGGLKNVGKKIVEKVSEKVAPKVAKSVEEIAPKLDEPIKEITDIFNKFKPLRGKQEAGYTAERAKRFAETEKAYQEIGGEKGFRTGLSKLKGELPKEAVPEGLRLEAENFVKSGKAEGLFTTIQKNKWMTTGEKTSAQTGLSKALTGQTPTEGELDLLQTVFGNKFTDSLKVSEPWNWNLWNVASEIGGTMKVLLSSLGDLSFYGRQGIMYATRHPVKGVKLIKEGAKGGVSEKYYDAVQDSIRSHEFYPLARRFNLALTEVGGASTKLSQSDEQFLVRYLKKIPGIGTAVNATERAFNTMANKARSDWFYGLVDDLLKNGKDPVRDAGAFKQAANFVNSFTGRADMGKVLNQATELLNLGIYSPRLIKSRLDILASPITYARANPVVRKEVWKTLISYYGSMVGILSAIDAMSDDVEVELDPRSTDFAKIKVGNRRWDITGGLATYVRLIAQMVTREKKTEQGQIKEVGEGLYSPEISFLRGKLSPLLSTIIDAWSGKNYTGEEATPTQLAKDHLINLMFQDIMDASEEVGLLRAVAENGIPAFFGVGTQTYDAKTSGKFSVKNYSANKFKVRNFAQ